MDPSPPQRGHCNNYGAAPSSAILAAAKSSDSTVNPVATSATPLTYQLSRKSVSSASRSNDVNGGGGSSSSSSNGHGDEPSGESRVQSLPGPLKKRRIPTKGSLALTDPKRSKVVVQKPSFSNTATTTNSDISESELELTTMRTSAHESSASVPATSVAGRNVEEPRSVKFIRELRPAPYFYYIDRSQEPDDDVLSPLSPPLCVPNFVIKLHAILIRMDLRRIISWMPHGRSWKIIDLPDFEKKVLPQYFKQSNMKSFHRQANGWGFRRSVMSSF